MPVLAGPAHASPLGGPAHLFTTAHPLEQPEPPAPLPDWDAEFSPVASAPLVQVMVLRTIDRKVIGEFTTAYVEDWADDVSVLETTSAAIRISSWEPLLPELADSFHVSAEGHLVYSWDPKGYIVTIHVDGAAVWTGVFRQPLDIGGGYHAIPAVHPSALFAERILGRAEQVDLLGDRGSFEYGSVGEMIADGWTFDPGVTPTLVADGVRGGKCLNLTGDGWAHSPRVDVMGGGQVSATVQGATFGKWQTDPKAGEAVVITRTKVASTLAEWNPAHSLRNAGQRPDDTSKWTDGPVTSGGILAPSAVPHKVWVDVRSRPGSNSRYDLVTIRQGVLTGAPPGTVRDLAWYVVRVFRDLHSLALGGSPTGLNPKILNESGTTADGMNWGHAQRTPFRDILTVILDRDGGPECTITPGWNLYITDKLGDDRDDISLSMHDIIRAGWADDPGAQVDDLVTDTGRGSGTSAVTVTKSQPFNPLRHRIVQIVTAPVERTLNQLDPWAQAFAEASARIQRTSTVPVAWHVAQQLNKGDTVHVTQHDGLAGMSQRMRVLTMRYRPMDRLVDCTLGPVDG